MSTPDQPTIPASAPASDTTGTSAARTPGMHGRRPTGRINLIKHNQAPTPPDVEHDHDDAPGEPTSSVVPVAGPQVVNPGATIARRVRVARTVHTITTVGRTAATRTATGARTTWTAGRTVVTHPYTKAGAKLTVRNAVIYPVAGIGVAWRRWHDTHGVGRYERMMRRAEVAGDHDALLEWESRDVNEKQRRHDRVMDWIHSPLDLIKAVAFGILGFAGFLLVLGIVLAIGNKDFSQVFGPITGVINAITFTAWFLATYGATMLLVGTGGCLVWLWHLGRTQVDPPAWAAPAEEAGTRDVIPDERAIVNALRNLNLPALNRKFKEGWSPRWELPPVHDGKGWHSQLLLPEGVTVEHIVNAKSVLAHNLLRLPVEVWPTEPRNRPGVLDLWVADQGSLTKPVAPWPLLKQGTTDYFKGVPVGVDPRGKVVLGRLFQANWGVAGMMGSGKSTLIITALLGAALDPLVDIDVYCMAVNADYDPLKPRLRTLFVSDDVDEIPTVLNALTALMSDLSERGRKLSEAGEPKLTRALAEKDPTMRPRVVVIDECQELFVSEHGAAAAELVEKIVAKARKYGVTLIFATPVPSADSLPRKVAKVLSNRACFAIGDHQGNDAILGTGKHKAGITATTLRPMTVDSDGSVDLGDLGTAMATGFTPADGLMRCFYVRRGEGVDDVTPVVERAMAAYRDTGPIVIDVDPIEKPSEPLDDIATVLDGHKRLRTQEVLAGLAGINKARYGGWTPAKLKAYLADHDVRVVKSSEGHMSVRTADVVEAQGTRLIEADDRDDVDIVDAELLTDGDEWDSSEDDG